MLNIVPMEGQIEKVQKNGQLLYRKKDYQAALECFNSIITDYIDAPLSVWDNRAAVYTKLGDLQAALRDGKRMIHIAKAQATGYLRTGQVLRFMGKEDVALGIYKYGLRNVPTNHPDFKLLRGIYENTLAKSMPPKAVDPLLVLPLELVEMVFQYLSFNNVVGLLRVSKAWRRLVESLPSLWRHLDLSKAQKNVPKSAIRACVQRSNRNIDRVTLYRWGKDDIRDNILRYVINLCRDLDYLEIRDGTSNGTLMLSLPLAPKLTILILGPGHVTFCPRVNFLLANCNNLKRAEFHCVIPSEASHTWDGGGPYSSWKGDFSKLKALKLNSGKAGFSLSNSFGSLDGLFEKVSNLRELTLQGWHVHPDDSADFSLLTHLEDLDIAGTLLLFLPPLPISLRSLDLTNCHKMDFSCMKSQQSIWAGNLTNLCSLSISRVLGFDFIDLDTLLIPSKGKLKRLAVGDMYDHRFNLVENHLQELHQLNLSKLDISDETAELIAERSPRLKILDLSYTAISGVGVKALVLKDGDKLEKLNLQHCISVSSDAVDYARANGVDVIFNFPDQLKYSKKVRST